MGSQREASYKWRRRCFLMLVICHNHTLKPIQFPVSHSVWEGTILCGSDSNRSQCIVAINRIHWDVSPPVWFKKLFNYLVIWFRHYILSDKRSNFEFQSSTKQCKKQIYLFFPYVTNYFSFRRMLIVHRYVIKGLCQHVNDVTGFEITNILT
jgi:hypothetical protein